MSRRCPGERHRVREQLDSLSEPVRTDSPRQRDDYAARNYPQRAIGILTLRERLPIHDPREDCFLVPADPSLSVDGDVVVARARRCNFNSPFTDARLLANWNSDTSFRDQADSRRKEELRRWEKILTGRRSGVVDPTLRSSPLPYRSRDREIFASPRVSCGDPAIRGANREERAAL